MKYRDKIQSLEKDVEAVMKEEEAEKSILKAEIEANRAMKLLEEKQTKKKKGKKAQQLEDEKKRIWFQTHKERMKGMSLQFWVFEKVDVCSVQLTDFYFHALVEKEKLKGMLGRPNADDRQVMAEVEEERKLKKLQDFQIRQAKRKRKKTVGGDVEFGAQNGGPAAKKTKRRSNFDDELTNTKKAREFRHVSKGPKPKSAGPTNKAARKFSQKTGKFKRK